MWNNEGDRFDDAKEEVQQITFGDAVGLFGRQC